MSDFTSTVPARVAGYIRAALTHKPDHLRIGPFVAAFDPHSTGPWRNYACPLDGARPRPDEVAELIAVFEQHGRVPRFEYVPAAAPDVEAALLAAGFTVEGRPVLMACPAASAAALPVPVGIVLAAATEAGDLLDVATVQNEAYGEPEPAGPHDVDRLLATVARGGFVALARDAATGEAVGTGLVTDPQGGLAELAAVATRASHRRRGIASSLAAHLARAAHEGGADLVRLEPAGRAEELVYTPAGFGYHGHKLWISRH